MSALTNFTSTPATQREKSRPNEVLNNAGGYVFEVSDQARLDRFLILGTDKGTYYVEERDLTRQNIDFLREMIAENAQAVLDTTVAISDAGRAYRNEAAIFVMALLLSEGPATIKSAVVEATPKVARTATHVYQLAQFIENMGGWGRAKRKAIAGWFDSKRPDELAYQAVKYRQRNGWTLRDLMRLSHPTGVDERIGGFILGRETNSGGDIIDGFQTMQLATSNSEVISTLQRYTNLPWETIPTQFLKEPEVWKTLFHNGQLKGQALVRQITRLSKIGAFNDMVFTRELASMLTDSDMIAKTRLHPIQYLLAHVTHTEGQLNRNEYGWFGSQRNKTWVTNPVIADALDAGFHASFKNITPADKRTLLALDVSGSMSSDAIGIDLSCAMVSAAMAMVTARTEPWYQVMGFATQFRDLGITAKMDLSTVMRKTANATMGGTDVAQPMVWALNNKVEVDSFIVYTDNETWAGRIKPDVALKNYRQKMGIDAKLIVVGCAATPFTVGDPNDAKTLNVAGFDSNAPGVIADFSAGRI
jgi:60 kDa SS-A/Ro ribonucleoprotein